MNIWLITTGEPLPLLQNVRPHRVGSLARLLSEKGHEVTWWASTVDHQNKTFLYNHDKIIEISTNWKIILLHSFILYKKNVSLRRILNHKLVARRFLELSKSYEKPDIIFCSFPTIDLIYAAVKYGKKNRVPVVIDVRDLWPDIFLDQFPSYFQPLAKQLLKSFFNQAERIFQGCDSITAVSEKYLEWALKYGQREKSVNDAVFPLGYEKPDVSESELFDHERYLAELGVDTLKTTVWFVGTFGQTYDLGTVIQGAHRLLEYREDIHFVFTGDGERKNEWVALAKGLNNVIFTGWVDKVQLMCLSRIADIGLMAYADNAPQGLPNKIFEYLSAGIPILSSLQGETKALLEKYGVGRTYQANNIDSFIGALVPLIDDHERIETGNRGKALFEQKYAAHIIYSDLIYFIECVLDRYNSKES